MGNDLRGAATLERARDLSRELLAAAGSGDSRSATDLDGQRLLLLQSVCQSARPLSPNERRLLQEISELNDNRSAFSSTIAASRAVSWTRRGRPACRSRLCHDAALR